MSKSEHHDEVVVSEDGVEVTKRFEDEEFPVPAIVFEFTSARAEDVTIQLSDTVPESVSVEDLGFHPEYGSEYWTIEEGKITFERTIPAETSYTTVYGIRATGSDDVERFLTEPTFESIEPPLPEGETAPTVDHISVEEAVTDSSDTGKAAIDADEAPGAEDSVESLDLGETSPSRRTSTPGETADAAADTGADAGTEATLVASLAAELRGDAAAQTDVSLLREALQSGGARADPTAVDQSADRPDGPVMDDDTEASGTVAARLAQLRDDVNELRSMQARLDRLQRDVADLRAYTGALEEFLDDNGTGGEILADLEDRLEAMEARLDTIEDESSADSS